MSLSSRNESLGFAERTKKNLEYIEECFDNEKDVHIVTQIINSLLGLIVFPWEAGFDEAMEDISLDDLENNGWPVWKITKGSEKCTTLGRLIRFLRNGAAHRNLEFSSDSCSAHKVVITIWNCPTKSTDRDWIASMRADDLRTFCLKFFDLLEKKIG